MAARGLYLHIPFCIQKCAYCAFYSLVADETVKNRYTEALISAISGFQPSREIQIDSVYFGGGTPTVLGAERLCALLSAISARFSLTADAEITCEANPGTVHFEMLQKMRQAGFNRLSLGVQSLFDHELAALGRIHSAKAAEEAILMAKDAGFSRLSADLMVGIPEQTEESFLASLHRLCALPIDHLSAYLLSIEPGTKFAAVQKQLALPSEDEVADRYLLLCDGAEALGFAQYEVSNFAKNGSVCRHNLHYWRCEEYLAFGPAAHGYLDGRRYCFPETLTDFITAAEQGGLTPEDLGAGGDFDEVFFLGMRLKEGVSLSLLERRFDRLLSRLRLRARPLIDAGFLTLSEEDVLSFTPKGFSVSNQILAELLF